MNVSFHIVNHTHNILKFYIVRMDIMQLPYVADLQHKNI